MTCHTAVCRKPLEIFCLLMIAGTLPLGGCALRRAAEHKAAMAQTAELGEAIASDDVPQRDALPPLPVASSAKQPESPPIRLPSHSPSSPARTAGPAPTPSITAVSLQLPPPPLNTARAESRPTDRPTGAVIHGNRANFDEQVLRSEVPVLVDFYASWCGPCKVLSPTLDQVAAESPHAKVVKINVDDSPELAARYGVKSLPSLIVFNDGRIMAKEKGLVSKTRLKAMLDTAKL